MSRKERLGLQSNFNWSKFGLRHIEDSINEAIAEVQSGMEGTRVVFPTKFPRLNRQLMGGLTPGKLYVIGGRPGVGKSAFSNQLVFDVLDVANNRNQKLIVLYWSFEMPGSEQVLRIASKETGLSVDKLLSVDEVLQDTNFIRFTQTTTSYEEYPIYFCDNAKTINDVVLTVERVQKEFPGHTIMNVFDHSRLFKKSNEKSELERLVNISHGCMGMQATTKCINVILSQLNRTIETADRAKNQYQPMLSDLFGSDSIGQDAHVVMMLNRPHDLYKIETEYCGEDPKGLLAVHIEKNRGGRLGMIGYEADMRSFKIMERKKPVMDEEIVEE